MFPSKSGLLKIWVNTELPYSSFYRRRLPGRIRYTTYISPFRQSGLDRNLARINQILPNLRQIFFGNLSKPNANFCYQLLAQNSWSFNHFSEFIYSLAAKILLLFCSDPMSRIIEGIRYIYTVNVRYVQTTIKWNTRPKYVT